MIRKSLKHVAWSLVVAGIAVTACSRPKPPEEAFVLANLQPPAQGAGLCNVSPTNAFFSVGNRTSDQSLPETIPNGDMALAVTCTVSPNNGGYDIQASAIAGAGSSEGGGLTISGHVDPGQETNSGLTAFFAGSQGAFYQKQGCTVTWMYNNSLINANQRAVPGEVFGHIDCPELMAEGSENMVVFPDGGSAITTCDGYADFLFENCGE